MAMSLFIAKLREDDLMGISRITAYTIASNPDIVCTQAGPAENGKYLGWITLGEDARYRALLNTEPVYDTPEEAVAAMEQLVVDTKAAVEKETKGEDPIKHVLGEETGSIVRKIVDASKDKS